MMAPFGEATARSQAAAMSAAWAFASGSGGTSDASNVLGGVLRKVEYDDVVHGRGFKIDAACGAVCADQNIIDAFQIVIVPAVSAVTVVVILVFPERMIC